MSSWTLRHICEVQLLSCTENIHSCANGCSKTHIVGINHTVVTSCYMFPETVRSPWSYTWNHRTFMTGNKMAEKMSPAVLDMGSFTGNFKSTVSFDLWFPSWITEEACSAHTGLSDEYGPLHKSLITPRPLYLCPAGEQEVLNLATIERLWKLYSWADTPPQTSAILGWRNTVEHFGIKINDKRLKSRNDRIMPSLADLQG